MADEKYVKISEASKFLAISEQTLRNYHRKGILVPARVRKSGHREYSMTQLENFIETAMGVK